MMMIDMAFQSDIDETILQCNIQAKQKKKENNRNLN